jgi:hypothetical protein
MRRRSPSDDSSDGSEYVESDVDNGAASDTDGETCVDEASERDEDMEDHRAWLVAEEIPREHYISQLETFDEAQYTKEDYEDSSTRLIDRMENLWNEYVAGPFTPETSMCEAKLTRCRCWTYLGKDRFRVYSTVSIRTLHTFFDWLLGRQRGKRGRKLRGTKTESSLGTYWKIFRLVYERATDAKVDGRINRGMHKVHSRRYSIQALHYYM